MKAQSPVVVLVWTYSVYNILYNVYMYIHIENYIYTHTDASMNVCIRF